MTAAQRKGGTERACFHVALICWALAALGMAWALTFGMTNYQTAMLEARAYQRDKAQAVASQILSYSSVATQLVDTLAIFIEHYDGHSPKQVETYLDLLMESAPSEFIYGAGVWWEPFAFDSKRRHFAPYVFREESDGKRILTYYWSSEAFDYHQRFWYKMGIKLPGTSAITDPYVEEDFIFISIIKPFYARDSKLVKGIVSVDLLPPRMPILLKDMEIRPSDTVMIVGHSGRLIAHSSPETALAQARRLHPDKELRSILDVQFADSQISNEDSISYSHYVPSLGWSVVIVSNPADILTPFNRVRRILVITTIAYLLILTTGYFTICFFLQSLERQRENFLYAEKMASLGEMAGSIAHEINNPLAIIQGAAQKMQIRLRHDEINREDLRQTVAIVVKTTERIARIIRSLRFVARDGSTDPFANTGLRAIIDETLVLSEARLRKEDIRMETSIMPADLSCVCRAVQISQVLINLINNSIDAIHGQPEKWIRIEATERHNMVQITVTDSGSGISKDLADKIMKPFFTTKSVGKGTGLGLSISRSIAQDHGGNLQLDPGSTHTRFVLTLPKAQGDLESAYG